MLFHRERYTCTPCSSWTLTPLPQWRKKSRRETIRDRMNKLSLCSTNLPQSSSDVWNSPKRTAPPRGCPSSHSKNMVSTSTKESSGMHYACAMDGSQIILPRPVTVVLSLQSIMPWSATWDVSQPSVTMRFVTSQLHFLLKSATMLPPGPHSNRLVGRVWQLTLQTLVMEPM